MVLQGGIREDVYIPSNTTGGSVTPWGVLLDPVLEVDPNVGYLDPYRDPYFDMTRNMFSSKPTFKSIFDNPTPATAAQQNPAPKTDPGKDTTTKKPTNNTTNNGPAPVPDSMYLRPYSAPLADEGPNLWLWGSLLAGGAAAWWYYKKSRKK